MCHEGQAIEIMEDGSIDVTDGVIPVLVSHGFKLWGSDSEGPGSAEAFGEEILSSAAIKELGKKAQADGNMKEEALALAADATNVSAWSRKELFAFLKANGVSVSLPITNARLRALALEVENGHKGCADFFLKRVFRQPLRRHRSQSAEAPASIRRANGSGRFTDHGITY